MLTRHFVWHRSRTDSIDRGTRDVFRVSEILGDLPAGVVDVVERNFVEGLAPYFGVEATAFRMQADRPAVDW